MTQTAMREMLSFLQELRDRTTDESESYMLIAIWVHAVCLMEKEKEQLKNTFIAGNKLKQAGIFSKKVEVENGFEKHYNKTFKK